MFPKNICNIYRRWDGKNSKDSYGKPVIRVEFRKSHCSACPVRSQCTRSKVHSRGLTLMIQEDYEALAYARQRQTTEDFRKQYALRSGIEGTISQGVRGFNLRQCRYLGKRENSVTTYFDRSSDRFRKNLCLA